LGSEAFGHPIFHCDEPDKQKEKGLFSLQISSVKFNSALLKDPRNLNSTVISGLWFNKLLKQENTSKKLPCCSQNTLSHFWNRKNIPKINTRNQNFHGMQTQLEIQNFAQSHQHVATFGHRSNIQSQVGETRS
jgi:hypothetical protein